MIRIRNGAAAFLAAAFACVAVFANAQAKERPVQLITLDPGHFHAALVQKFMLPGVRPEVLVFAPEGEDVAQHLKRIEGFNARKDNPTHWVETVHTGPDYLKQAVFATSGGNSHPGASRDAARATVVVISGKWQSERTTDGKMVTAGPNRNTVALHKRGDRWLIVQFHNSPTPKPKPAAPPPPVQ